jgi:small subunit ribosomal protein S4
MAASRREARQLVSHRHFAVNGRTVNVASYQVRPGDVVALREGHRDLKPTDNALALVQGRPVPDWLSLDADKKQGTILRLPERHEMDMFIDEQLIVEYYSR